MGRLTNGVEHSAWTDDTQMRDEKSALVIRRQMACIGRLQRIFFIHACCVPFHVLDFPHIIDALLNVLRLFTKIIFCHANPSPNPIFNTALIQPRFNPYSNGKS